MDMRLSLYFQQAYWGWTENWGMVIAGFPEADVKAKKLISLRKELLASGDDARPQITAYRLYSGDPNERSTILTSVTFKEGTTSLDNGTSDMAWNAVHYRVVGPNLAANSNRHLRGIPDDFIKFDPGSRSASFKPQGGWFAAWQAYALELVNGGWGWFHVTKVKLAGGGTVYTLTFKDISNARLMNVSHRQTGRPFDSPRGRKWARVVNKRGR